MNDDSDEPMTPTDHPTILVVDDDRSVADVYARWLGAEYDVRVAYGGRQALQKLDESVAVVLLDRRMPELSGDELLRTIRAEGLTCRVAMITAVEPDVDVIDLGFDEYLRKPVSRDLLRRVVDRLLTRTVYDVTVQNFFALASKLAVLEEQADRTDFAASQDHAAVRTQMRDARRQANLTLSEFTDDDFEAVFRHSSFTTAAEPTAAGSATDVISFDS